VVRRAARHKVEDLTSELAAYKGQAEGLVRRALSSRDDHLATWGKKVGAALQELAELQELFADGDADYKSLCSWFHEGVSRPARPPDEFFGVWDGFLQAVRESLEKIYSGGTRMKATIHRPIQQLVATLTSQGACPATK